MGTQKRLGDRVTISQISDIKVSRHTVYEITHSMAQIHHVRLHLSIFGTFQYEQHGFRRAKLFKNSLYLLF
jgi:hypothetical protein